MASWVKIHGEGSRGDETVVFGRESIHCLPATRAEIGVCRMTVNVRVLTCHIAADRHMTPVSAEFDPRQE